MFIFTFSVANLFNIAGLKKLNEETTRTLVQQLDIVEKNYQSHLAESNKLDAQREVALEPQIHAAVAGATAIESMIAYYKSQIDYLKTNRKVNWGYILIAVIVGVSVGLFWRDRGDIRTAARLRKTN